MPARRLIKWENLFDLVLDPNNPRHEAGLNRREIIQYLVAKESVLNLAKDVVANGLSPLDLFGGIENEDGDIVIVEGNRRLCSMILVNDPSLAPIRERQAFEKLHEDLDPNLEIEVTLFEDQAEADIWIERKHSGHADGVGPRPWTAPQKARHYGARNSNALALALLDFAVAQKLITAAESQGRIITTVTRFVSNPYVRRHGLGIHTNRNDPDFKYDGKHALFKKRLSILLRDIIAGTNGATSRSGAKEREEYAKANLVPVQVEDTSNPDNNSAGPNSGSDSPGGGTSEGGASGDSTDPSGAQSDTDSADADEDGSSGGGSSPHPSKRPRLIPATFNPDFESHKLRRVFLELRECRRTAPIAAALLVRVFLEATCVAYLETQTGYISKDNDKLHLMMHKALEHIESMKKAGDVVLTKADLSALHSLRGEVAQPTFVYSAAYLGKVAHGHAFPEWATLTAKWDEIEAIVRYIADNCEPRKVT